MTDANRNLVLAITGASGTAFAIRLTQVLLRNDVNLHIVCSDAARMVATKEVGLAFPGDQASADEWASFLETSLNANGTVDWGFSTFEQPISGTLYVHSQKDFSAGIASGSFLTQGMVICPCSMGTLASISHGQSANLIQRAADVHLKERRTLIVVPRETPLSSLALGNMTRLSEAGATILPAMPGYYHDPKCLADLVDFIVARICDQLRIPHQLMQRWGE